MSASEKTVKFAATVLLLYTALTPLVNFVSGLGEGDFKDYLEQFEQNGTQTDAEYQEVAGNL